MFIVPELYVVPGFRRTDLLPADRAAQFLLQPISEAAFMKHMSANKSIDPVVGVKLSQTNRTALLR